MRPVHGRCGQAHFSWHFLSGGNAFDIFQPEEFKEKIREFPAEEAPRMQRDFTRLNFGWWGFWSLRTQPTCSSTARAGRPPGIARLRSWRKRKRSKRIRAPTISWRSCALGRCPGEEVADAGTEKGLQNLEQEHILLIDENGAYELAPYDPITGAAVRERQPACVRVRTAGRTLCRVLARDGQRDARPAAGSGRRDAAA